MPTEQQVVTWIAANWPSIAAAIVFSMVFLRLDRLYRRLETAEKDSHAAMKLAKKLVKTHLRRHSEDIDKLMNGDSDNEGGTP